MNSNEEHKPNTIEDPDETKSQKLSTTRHADATFQRPNGGAFLALKGLKH